MLSQLSVPAALAAFLVPLALAGAASADPASDCRDVGRLSDQQRLAHCTAALEVARDDRERAGLHIWRGVAHRTLGDRDAALADFAEAEWLVPFWAGPMIERAYLLSYEGEDAAAAEEALRGLAAEPESVDAIQSAMDLLAGAGRTEECLDLVPDAMRLAPEHPHTFASRGRCLHEGGRAVAAIADYRRALELGLDEAFLHSNLSRLLLDIGATAEGLSEARRALELDPGLGLALRNLAVGMVESGEPEAAVAAWREGAPRLENDRDVGANDLAWTLYAVGRHAEGLAVLEEALAAGVSLDRVDAVDTHAHLLAANGRPEEAVEAFLRAAELGGEERRAIFEASLSALGFAPGKDLAARLRACAATGAACRLNG
jgi:tetratricopeptide (TPR) repeat protein